MWKKRHPQSAQACMINFHIFSDQQTSILPADASMDHSSAAVVPLLAAAATQYCFTATSIFSGTKGPSS